MEMAATKRQPRILILLVWSILFLSPANGIRSMATDKNHIVKELYIFTEESTGHNLPTGSPKTEQPADQGPQMNGFEENCSNIDEEEECLMRRTLAAHVDYIYTQEHNP
uniref:Phytosulfokine n=1 Tax=Picea sitchensis TaxID=3332 RepID=B8LN38_PICSI|nr:unknown [Picea sitchensis]